MATATAIEYMHSDVNFIISDDDLVDLKCDIKCMCDAFVVNDLQSGSETGNIQ